MEDLIITKKDGDIVILLENETINMRLQLNPWTLKVIDFKMGENDNERKIIECKCTS